MQQYTPETELFFRPRPQAEDEKIPRLRGYIVAYTTTKHHIYNIYPIWRDQLFRKTLRNIYKYIFLGIIYIFISIQLLSKH